MKKEPDFDLPIDPRYNLPALSWSSLLRIEANAEKWYEEEFLGRKKYRSDAMAYGLSVHAKIKHNKIKVPRGDNKEKPLSCLISPRGGTPFYLCGTPDDFDTETIYEYKTGAKLWNKKQADEHGQIFTYALLLWRIDGILRKKGKLISLQTKYDTESESRVLNKKERHIDTEISLLDILKIEARFIRGYKKAIETIKRRASGKE